MTVSQLMEKLSLYPDDMEVQIVVDFPPEVVVEVVDLAMEQGGKPFTLAAYPTPDLRVERCGCEDGDHKLVSIDVCGLCLVGLEHDSMGRKNKCIFPISKARTRKRKEKRRRQGPPLRDG